MIKIIFISITTSLITSLVLSLIEYIKEVHRWKNTD